MAPESHRRRWVLAFFKRSGTYYNGHLNEARIRASYRPSRRRSFDFSQHGDRFRLPIWRRRPIRVRLFSDYCAFSRFLTRSTIFQVNTSNTRRRVPTFVSAGTTAPTAICSLFTPSVCRRVLCRNTSHALQIPRSSLRTVSPSNTRTPGVRRPSQAFD